MRPLSELPVAIGNMASAAGHVEQRVVPKATLAIRTRASVEGGRYRIKGRSGRPVRLSASSNTQMFGGKPVGQVRGVPPGFWRIVTDGSAPHLITGRYRRGGTGRVGVSSALRRFAGADAMNTASPIRLGSIGWRQYAVHPGHGSLGDPWGRAMRAAPELYRSTLDEVATTDLVRAWKK